MREFLNSRMYCADVRMAADKALIGRHVYLRLLGPAKIRKKLNPVAHPLGDHDAAGTSPSKDLQQGATLNNSGGHAHLCRTAVSAAFAFVRSLDRSLIQIRKTGLTNLPARSVEREPPASTLTFFVGVQPASRDVTFSQPLSDASRPAGCRRAAAEEDRNIHLLLPFNGGHHAHQAWQTDHCSRVVGGLSDGLCDRKARVLHRSIHLVH